VSIRLIPGAVSATFKKIPVTADEIIALLQETGLECVEWSENVHVFPDDPEGAEALGKKTRAAGLRVAAYGSYYRLGENENPEETFLKSLRSAEALGAPYLRVWAGTLPSCEVDDALFETLAAEAGLIGRLADKAGLRVAFEWHKNTLTDTNESAMRLLSLADCDNLCCLWQPTVALSPRERVEGIRLLGKRLANLHVYSWPDGKRGPLNAAEWAYYFDAVRDGEHCAMLEFVRDDSLDQFKQDAAVLTRLIHEGGYYG